MFHVIENPFKLSALDSLNYRWLCAYPSLRDGKYPKCNLRHRESDDVVIFRYLPMILNIEDEYGRLAFGDLAFVWFYMTLLAKYRINAWRIASNNKKEKKQLNKAQPPSKKKLHVNLAVKEHHQSTIFVTLHWFHEIFVKIARNSFPVRKFEMFNCWR